MLRRLAFTAATAAAASAAALSAAPTAAADTDLLPLPPLFTAPDQLTITVQGVGGDADGTYELECGPAGGTHPNAAGACRRLDEQAAEGRDPFAPRQRGAMCTMQYGGPATAHVTGIWHGRPVDATYDRGDGCEVARWDAVVPVLPAVRA
ncbi:SSI family serine proteinase inhibitor [Streptomyces jeddahensis]|uniref:Subtilisin inhibitor-like protein 1 n=1 Tax=Streptomyces jeddahensis TaxID=1716141 RepID=A0A177HVQ5_9ACTN|nr:SSI family serine proteinase inhibitor [Streptomyces jeddahensis]OAH15032.1 subtilisin inhibitor-like protein 1 [Streptomyces jeddahensis]